MSLIKNISLVIVVIFLSLSVGAKKRTPNSLQSDFEALSGSYKLEKGEFKYCPDGEITAKDDSLTIGANIRIEGVNKKKISDKPGKQSDCGTESYSKFDGKKITSVVDEKCSGSVKSHTKYEINSYSGRDTKYLSLKVKRTYSRKGEESSKIEYECLYSREISSNF